MRRNIGRTDRTIRLVAGVLLLALGVLIGSWWGLIGLIPLGTAFIGWCPVYAPFGFSTYRESGKSAGLQHT